MNKKGSQSVWLSRIMEKKDKDIFDRIMSAKIWGPLGPFYFKNKEVLLYLFFGGLTTVVSIASYYVAYKICDINVLIANIISWIFAVTFAYITNKIWVFDSKAKGAKAVLAEITKFYTGRLATLVVEEAIILVFDTLLHFNSMIVKLVAQIIIIVLNYVISKIFVFKKN